MAKKKVPLRKSNRGHHDEKKEDGGVKPPLPVCGGAFSRAHTVKANEVMCDLAIAVHVGGTGPRTRRLVSGETVQCAGETTTAARKRLLEVAVRGRTD